MKKILKIIRGFVLGIFVMLGELIVLTLITLVLLSMLSFIRLDFDLFNQFYDWAKNGGNTLIRALLMINYLSWSLYLIDVKSNPNRL